MKSFWTAALLTFFWSGLAGAASFEEILRSSLEHSYELQAQLHEESAAQSEISRSKRHWLPTLEAGLQQVSSDSPATALFSGLGSRSVSASSFSPSAINHPAREWYQNLQVKLDLPLYEGGARSAQVTGAKLKAQGLKLATESQRQQIYADVVSNYTRLQILAQEQQQLKALRTKLAATLKGYQVGSKSNPVGYSGLLGLRALLNRIESSLAYNQSLQDSALHTLRIHSGLSELSLAPFPKEGPIRFASERLDVPTEGSFHLAVASQEKLSQAGRAYAQAEKARWRPQAGLFISQLQVTSPADTGQAQEYGAYLRWRLDGTSLGTYGEQFARARAAEARTDALRERVQIRRNSLHATLPTLQENMRRLEESEHWTAEQVDVTTDLFQRGSVGALQFSEVLARRADVITAKTELQMNLLNTLAERYLLYRGEK